MKQLTARIPKKFLGIRYTSCMCYGRLYENADKTAYVGNCPRCGRAYNIRIGAEGSNTRMFTARCK